MTDKHRVYEGQKFHEFDIDTIDKMRELGLIRSYGFKMVGERRIYKYHPSPRSRKVSGKKW